MEDRVGSVRFPEDRSVRRAFVNDDRVNVDGGVFFGLPVDDDVGFDDVTAAEGGRERRVLRGEGVQFDEVLVLLEPGDGKVSCEAPGFDVWAVMSPFPALPSRISSISFAMAELSALDPSAKLGIPFGFTRISPESIRR